MRDLLLHWLIRQAMGKGGPGRTRAMRTVGSAWLRRGKGSSMNQDPEAELNDELREEYDEATFAHGVRGK